MITMNDLRSLGLRRLVAAFPRHDSLRRNLHR